MEREFICKSRICHVQKSESLSKQAIYSTISFLLQEALTTYLAYVQVSKDMSAVGPMLTSRHVPKKMYTKLPANAL